MSYDILMKLKQLDYKNRHVLIIGGGWMGRRYCNALSSMGIHEIDIITRSHETAKKCSDDHGVSAFTGGYEVVLPKLGSDYDLVIVAVSIESLFPAAQAAIDCGHKNILIEKPGSLYSGKIRDFNKSLPAGVNIRIAWNRLMYPNLWKFRQLVQQENQRITSCRYTFTEWIHTFDFNKETRLVYQRWAVANTLHVISMAHSLIGLPRKIQPFQAGSLDWHPAGDRFTGSGITERDILFSWHADWNSAGRWGIEVMTDKGAYRFIPMEKLFFCPKGSVAWQEISFDCPWPDVKQGVAEQVALMLCHQYEKQLPLATLQMSADYTKIAETIMGYSSTPEK